MHETGSRASECFGDIGPGIYMTTTAGLDDGQGGGIGGAALFVAGAETKTASDHRDAQGALGLIVRRGQMGIADEGDDKRRGRRPEKRRGRRPEATMVPAGSNECAGVGGLGNCPLRNAPNPAPLFDAYFYAISSYHNSRAPHATFH